MKKSIAIYDPYLDTLGGGEKYLLSVLKTLEDDYQPCVFWKKNIRNEIEKKFDLRFQNNISFQEKIHDLNRFNIYLYITDGSYQFSQAKKTFIYAMIPQKNLYRMSMLNKIKTLNSTFITHSKFNQQHLKKWGINARLLYPYIDDRFMTLSSYKKDKIILTVGRFFKQLHAKRQDIIVNTFKKLIQQRKSLKNFKLILAGGLKEEDKDYYDELKQLINNDPSITLIANPSFHELAILYKKSLMYWHFAGFGADENKNPELVEHLGITPLEAMASGCITFCYNAGGPKELIKDGDNGFLFDSEEELENKIIGILNDNAKQEEIRITAKKYIENNFSYEVFKENIKKIFI